MVINYLRQFSVFKVICFLKQFTLLVGLCTCAAESVNEK